MPNITLTIRMDEKKNVSILWILNYITYLALFKLYECKRSNVISKSTMKPEWKIACFWILSHRWSSSHHHHQRHRRHRSLFWPIRRMMTRQMPMLLHTVNLPENYSDLPHNNVIPYNRATHDMFSIFDFWYNFAYPMHT